MPVCNHCGRNDAFTHRIEGHVVRRYDDEGRYVEDGHTKLDMRVQCWHCDSFDIDF